MTGNYTIWRAMVWLLKDKITKRYTINSYSSSRLLMSRGSIVWALWIRWASRAFLKESRPILSFSIGIWLSEWLLMTQKLNYWFTLAAEIWSVLVGGSIAMESHLKKCIWKRTWFCDVNVYEFLLRDSK